MKNSSITAVILWLLLLSGAVIVTTKTQISTDMSAFLPNSTGPEEQLLLEQLQNGNSNRVLLLAINAKNSVAAARLSSQLATTLRNAPHFTRVRNGELQLGDSIQEPWFRYRYLLKDSDFSVTGLHEALQKRLQELRSLTGLYTKQNLAADPTANFRHLLQQWQGNTTPLRQHGVWFSTDGRALLLAETRAAGFDLDAQQDNLAVIRNAFATLHQHDSAQLVISGAPAIAVASRETIRSEARLATLTASLAVVLILLLAYRSWRLLLLSALPLAGAMLTALATTTLLFGTVHGITIAFGITLLGIAIDYPIHLFSHLTVGESPARSLAGIWKTLRLGVASTAIGFISLLFTRFDGLIQLGSFTVSGLLAAALITRYLLPPLLPSPWQGKHYSRLPTRSRLISHISLPLTTVLMLLSLAYLSSSDRPLWESDITALSPIPESVRQQDRLLRANLPVSDVNQMLLLQADDVESLLQTQERLKPIMQSWVADGLIGGYTLLADRLPSMARQHQRQAALPTTAQLKQRLNQAEQGLPFRSAAFSPFISAVSQSRDLPPLTLEQIQNTSLGQSLTCLLFKSDTAWWGIIPIAAASDTAILQQNIAATGEKMRYIELRGITDRMLTQFRDTALQNLAWGGMAILLLLGWSSHNLHQLTRIILPLSATISVTVALLHLLGEQLTLFHLTSLLLVIGIGIDYGLFFSRTDKPSEQGKTAHALRVCAISTATVFAILALSRLPILHAIGMTVVLGVVAAYWFARICGVQYNAKEDSTATADQVD